MGVVDYDYEYDYDYGDDNENDSLGVRNIDACSRDTQITKAPLANQRLTNEN